MVKLHSIKNFGTISEHKIVLSFQLWYFLFVLLTLTANLKNVFRSPYKRQLLLEAKKQHRKEVRKLVSKRFRSFDYKEQHLKNRKNIFLCH